MADTGGGEAKAEVMRLIGEIEKTNLTLSNFEQFTSKVSGTMDMMDGVIESFFNEHDSCREAVEKIKAEKSFKENKEKGMVLLEDFRAFQDKARYLGYIQDWDFMQLKLLRIVLRKMSSLVSVNRGMEIEKDVLARSADLMKQLHEQYMKEIRMSQEENKRREDNIKTALELEMRTNYEIIAEALKETTENSTKAISLVVSLFNDMRMPPSPELPGIIAKKESKLKILLKRKPKIEVPQESKTEEEEVPDTLPQLKNAGPAQPKPEPEPTKKSDDEFIERLERRFSKKGKSLAIEPTDDDAEEPKEVDGADE